MNNEIQQIQQGIAPGAARRYAPRRWQFDRWQNRSGSTPVSGRVRSPHISGGQRAHSPGSCAMGQTDGRIALFQNAPLGRGIKRIGICAVKSTNEEE